MESLFQELEKNLIKQFDNIKKLLNIAREHNRALRQLDTDNLPEIIGREEAVAGMLARRETDRKKITDRLAGELGMEKDAVLSEFAARAPHELKTSLSALLDDMRELTMELTEVNSMNGDLSRQAMRFNALILKSLLPAGKNVYTPDGRRSDDRPGLSLLDKKV